MFPTVIFVLENRGLIGKYNLELEPPNYGVYQGDCVDLAADIPANSIDLIMTDPPWDYADWFSWLAELSLRVLKPGGSLFSMCGKVELDKVMRLCSEHLTYNWMCVGYQPQSNLQYMPRRIMEKWRPAVWYVKQPRKQGRFVSDLKSTIRDKRYHDWGQGESFFMYYMDKIGGEIILDPFAGGGTTAAVAKKLHKQCLTFELDEAQAVLARERIKTAEIPLPIVTYKQENLWGE